MPNPKISIIVPVFNKEKYVLECIESLTNQTYENLEIILVDDGSTDNSPKICDDCAADNSKISVIHKENGGPSSAWKAGFAKTTGDYVSFVDADDYIDPVMIEMMALKLKGIRREIVASDYAIVKANGSKTYVFQTLTPGEYTGNDLAKDVIPNLLGNENRLIHVSRCMKLIERSLIEDNSGYCDDKVRMGDDSTITLPVIMDAERIYIMDHKAYYFYRYLDDSIVHKYDGRAFDNNKLHYETLYRMISEKFADSPVMLDRMRESLDREEIFFLFHVVKNEVRFNPGKAREHLTKIRKDELVNRCLNNVKVKINGADNKLVYYVLKYPNIITISLLRLAFLVYYKR